MENRIGIIIKRLRNEQGKTQDELAAALNITSQSVSKWETALANPDITYIPLLAKFFNVSIEELFQWDDVELVDNQRGKKAKSFHELANKYNYGRQLTQPEVDVLCKNIRKKKSKGKNVLVVDDASFMRTTIAKLLQEDEFEIIGMAQNGYEAVEAADTMECDMIVMDIVMPAVGFGVSGFIAKPFKPGVLCEYIQTLF